jgi:hypothetical protein
VIAVTDNCTTEAASFAEVDTILARPLSNGFASAFATGSAEYFTAVATAFFAAAVTATLA